MIENTAVASYNDGGVERSINSNTVSVRVDELLDVTLTSLDPGPVPARAGDAVLTFELTNQGNGPEAFRLLANTAIGGNDFDVSFRAIAIDSNGNGVYDEGVDELLPVPQTSPVLAPDAALTVFVLVTVPEGVVDGQITNIDLSAQALTGSGAPGTTFENGGVDGGDAIVGNTGALAVARGSLTSTATSVELIKSVTLRDPFGGTSAVPGTLATFTIEARVNGTGSASNLVVTDAIPTGTTYVPGSLALDATPLTDVADGDAGTASDTDGITVSLGSTAAGARRFVTFIVIVDQ
ncbi:MAG: hypothetical protein ACK4RT_04835 [Erythrobacter sp.]